MAAAAVEVREMQLHLLLQLLLSTAALNSVIIGCEMIKLHSEISLHPQAIPFVGRFVVILV